ncbi:MAG: protein kinase [Polyangiaceae bacterium]|nr:protein kinase [Polyangiaceae bacterium]
MLGWVQRRLGLGRPAAAERSPARREGNEARHATPTGGAPESAEATRLRSLVEGDDALALAALGELATTLAERRALAAVRERARARGLGLELALRAARLHVARGEPERAAELLHGRDEPAALVLASDLRAAAGDTAGAIALLERALARDVDEPGALARHTRLVAATRAPRATLDAGATLLRAGPADTSLRIVREAGRGGAATVYEAVDEVLGRRVALKTYHRPADDRAQLLAEARLAVRLAGPNVVRIWDADPERGTITCEWAEGGSLRDALAACDPARLLPSAAWLLPVVDALATCHAAGFVHGDVKPGNILFGASSAPLLADFGLAGRAGEPARGGTRRYLSPERLAGGPLAPADDVFALGRVAEDAARALAGVGEVDGASRRLVERAAARASAVAGRPADAGALARDLRAELAGG